LNIPTYTVNNFSAGPGVVFLGVSGATPAADIGALSEGSALSVEVQVETTHIRQGYPRMNIHAFQKSHGAMISFSGLEWDTDNLLNAIGTGGTLAGVSTETFEFGGDPTPTTLAVHVCHKMVQSGHTMNIYGWQVVAEPALSLELGDDPHEFPYKFVCQRATTRWGGGTLAEGAQLIEFERQTA